MGLFSFFSFPSGNAYSTFITNLQQNDDKNVYCVLNLYFQANIISLP